MFSSNRVSKPRGGGQRQGCVGTLLIVLALGPPLLWAAWMVWDSLRREPPPVEYNIGHVLQLDVV
jgi:hypothetical protein